VEWVQEPTGPRGRSHTEEPSPVGPPPGDFTGPPPASADENPPQPGDDMPAQVCPHCNHHTLIDYWFCPQCWNPMVLRKGKPPKKHMHTPGAK